MRKIILVVICISALSLFGCSATVEVEAPVQPDIAAVSCYDGAPSWVTSGVAEGGLSAVGSAKVGRAGLSHARTMALANARDEISRMMGVKVKNMVKDFVQTTGAEDNETVDKVSVAVSRQVSSNIISGSRQAAFWMSQTCGEYFVLVVLDTQLAKDATITSMKNQQALYQLAQAKKAFAELDEIVDKEFAEPAKTNLE